MNNTKNIGEILINYSLYIVLGIMILAFIIVDPSFISVKNITNILSQASTRGILALGVAGIIVLQGTDLSSGRVLGLCAIISASLLQSVTYVSRMYPNLAELPIFVPLVIAVCVGAVFGLVNGFCVSKFKIHAFIATLGTQLIAYGISCIYIDRPPLGAQPVANLSDKYVNFVNGSIDFKFFELPFLVIYLIITALVMWFIWNKTRLGKNMFAIGGNPEAAAVSGVNLFKNIMAVFLISGILYGLAGFLEAGRVGSATSNTGINYDLDAISACVVGGVSFTGGVGTIPGVLIGTVILQFINYGLNFVGVSPYYQYIIKGAIIILAVSIDVRKYFVKK